MLGSSSSSSSILTFLCVILIISPWLCSCESAVQSFFQCLSSNQQPNFPITEVIFTPNNSSFLSTLNFYIKNLRFKTSQTPKPLAIVAAKHESHVQTTITCIKRVGLQIRIRSGGHDYEGLSNISQQPFIVLDLFNLRAINVNIADQSAWVQSGATMGELYYAIANKSRVHAFPGGVCTTLGAGGHPSGGGYGNLMRKFGLSVDNIVDAQIVNVKGEILNKQQMGEDLFWAIRGGGGGSVGVILSWKIKLVPVPSVVTVFNVDKNIEEGATDVVWQYQQVMDKLDENLFIRLKMHSSKGEKKGSMTGKVTLVGLYLGPAEKLLEIMNQNIPSLKLKNRIAVK